jgi:hypothetical protein
VVDIPDPLKAIVTEGALIMLGVGIESDALAAELAVGAKWTVSAHVADAAIVLPEQVSLVMLNGEAIAAIVPMIRSAVPVLVTVTVASEVRPMVTPPKGIRRSVLGAMESVTDITGTGVALPTPLSAKVTSGVAGSLLEILKVSDAAAAAVGANRIVTVQLDGGCGSVAPVQVSVATIRLKGSAKGSIRARSVMVRLPSPRLLMVMIWSDTVPFCTVPKLTGLTGATAIF